MVTINVGQEVVKSNQDVIDFLRNSENQCIFGNDKKITETCDSNCVKLKHFLGNPNDDRYGVHYEIQKNGDKIFAELHAEEHDTPLEIRDFLQNSLGLVRKPGPHKSYRGVTHEISCVGRPLACVVNDIDKAVCELYKKYEAYLDYVIKFWREHKSVDGCKYYDDFIK